MRKKLFSYATVLAILISLVPPAFAANGDTFDISQDGLEFMKRHETYASAVYEANGNWYIGYGSPVGKNDYPNGITRAEADELFFDTLTPYIRQVNQFISANDLDLKQRQFDAILSFTYSAGTDWMDPSCSFYNYLLNDITGYGDIDVVEAMAAFCYVEGKINEPLLRRRLDEAQLLLTADYECNIPDFHYLILNAAGGTVENEIVCYDARTQYGTLPATTRQNYTFDGWYTNAGVKLTESTTVSESMTVTAQWASTQSLNFSDVKTTDWFYTYVYDLYYSGVVNGHTATTFEPQLNVTRGEAMKLIILAAGNKEQAPTNGHWASGYLDFSIKHGLYSNAQADLNEPISRLEIAQIAYNALGLSRTNIASPFSDTSDHHVVALYDLGVVEGSHQNGDLVFLPGSNITRAEISAIIWRIDRLENDPTDNSGGNSTETAPKETITFGNHVVDVLPTVPKNQYNSSLFVKDSNGYMTYNSSAYRSKLGIDVSIYQGDIDWEKVKEAGVDFAIIRVGGRGYGSAGTIYEDVKFEQNIKGATEAGIDVGVYFFSQAVNASEGMEEANYVLDKVRGYNLSYPIVFDWERIGGADARTYNLATDALCAAANAFCKTVEDAGYDAMIYFNLDVGYLRYDLSKIMGYDFWLAQYNSVPTLYYHFDMWQYSDSGSVDGIAGKVDMNIQLIPK